MIIVPPGPAPVDELLTFPEPPEGFDPITLYRYREFWEYPEYSEFDTLQANFYTFAQLDVGLVRQLLEHVRAVADEQGYDLVACALWGRSILEIDVPHRFCVVSENYCFDVPAEVCIPFTNWCWPLGGSLWSAGFEYRIWLCFWNRNQGVGSLSIRALPLPMIAIVVVALVVILAVVIGVYKLFMGRAVNKTVQQGVVPILPKVGENRQPTAPYYYPPTPTDPYNPKPVPKLPGGVEPPPGVLGPLGGLLLASGVALPLLAS